MSPRFPNHPPIAIMAMALTFGLVLFSGQANARCTRMKIFEREDGTGDTTLIRVIGSDCYNRWSTDSPWHNKAKALHMTANIGCIKVWSSKDCTGQGQCVCQTNHRMLTSWNPETVGNTGALSFSECDTPAPATGGTIEAFDMVNFEGNKINLEIPENQCETLRNDETWKSKISSLRVTQGCVEFFNEAGCTGDRDKLWKSEVDYQTEFSTSTNEQEYLGSKWNNRVRSFRSCRPPVFTSASV